MEKTTTTTNNDITNNNITGNINLSVIQKKKFTIDGDKNRVIELNISDFSVINRFNDAYPKLQKLASECSNMFSKGITDDTDTDTMIKIVSDNIDNADKEMRKLIDYIFDSNVSEVCYPTGCMYDLVNGEFVFEHIMNTLFSLFEQKVNEEVKKVEKRMKKHTDKYTKR